MSHVDLIELVRNKVKELQAYQVENLDEGIKLHANENPYPPSPELLKKLFQLASLRTSCFLFALTLEWLLVFFQL